ncbi:hypothetical protein [Dyella telluris]|uniref:Lipoprotein n=1 Tax=Dyella telluris TaxID=2763498 RepID=A0A7G8Q3U5_9GAMM|nr:hypothetical protein [Dyella telluris]QNK01453.1 hypothetical protein H8F01_20860 [Dyella telluris]
MHTSSRLIAFACVVATLLLTGCHATVDARWASSDDTVDHWKKAMPNLPVEVRGALPGTTHEQIAQAIPNAKVMSTHDVDPTAARLVVELGQRATPRDDAYCAAPASAIAAGNAPAQQTMTLTICDGARLVATSSRPIDPAKASVPELASRVASLKKLALIGISREQIDAYQIQG